MELPLLSLPSLPLFHSFILPIFIFSPFPIPLLFSCLENSVSPRNEKSLKTFNDGRIELDDGLWREDRGLRNEGLRAVSGQFQMEGVRGRGDGEMRDTNEK